MFNLQDKFRIFALIFYSFIISFHSFSVSALCIFSPWIWPHCSQKDVGASCVYMYIYIYIYIYIYTHTYIYIYVCVCVCVCVCVYIYIYRLVSTYLCTFVGNIITCSNWQWLYVANPPLICCTEMNRIRFADIVKIYDLSTRVAELKSVLGL